MQASTYQLAFAPVPLFPGARFSLMGCVHGAWRCVVTALVSARERRELIGRFAEKNETKGSGFDDELGIVAQAILRRLLDGQILPSQQTLACELGRDWRTIRKTMRRLSELDIVYSEKRGGRPMTVRLDLDHLRDWLGCGPTEPAPNVGETYMKCRIPRARAATSSSSSSSASRPAASIPTNATEAHQQYQAMLAAVRKAVPSLPPAAKDYLWGWVGAYPVHVVQQAARKAALAGGRSVSYIEQIIECERASWAFPDEDSELIRDVEEHLRRGFDEDNEA